MSNRWRIVERYPDKFQIEYKGWFFWYRVRALDDNLKSAQERLTRVRRSHDWIPKIHREYY